METKAPPFPRLRRQRRARAGTRTTCTPWLCWLCTPDSRGCRLSWSFYERFALSKSLRSVCGTVPEKAVAWEVHTNTICKTNAPAKKVEMKTSKNIPKLRHQQTPKKPHIIICNFKITTAKNGSQPIQSLQDPRSFLILSPPCVVVAALSEVPPWQLRKFWTKGQSSQLHD